MNISNKFCSYTVATICGICLFVVTAAMDVTTDHATAGSEVDFILVGTVLSDEGKSVAIFEDNKTNRQKFHRLGDTIEGGLITEILKDRVFLVKDDVEAELKIGFGTASTFAQDSLQANYAGGIQMITTNVLEPVVFSTPGPLIDNTREPRPGEVAMSELKNSVVQSYDGRPEVLEVKTDGLLSKLGLKTGDIILSVNHRKISVKSGNQLESDENMSFADAVVDGMNGGNNGGNNQVRIKMERDGGEQVIYNMIASEPLTN